MSANDLIIQILLVCNNNIEGIFYLLLQLFESLPPLNSKTHTVNYVGLLYII